MPIRAFSLYIIFCWILVSMAKALVRLQHEDPDSCICGSDILQSIHIICLILAHTVRAPIRQQHLGPHGGVCAQSLCI